MGFKVKITRRQIRQLIKEAGEANISHFTNFEKDTGAFKQYAEDMLDTIADHYKDDKDNPTRIPQMSDKWRGIVTDSIAKEIVSAFAKGIGYNKGTGGSRAPEWHRKSADDNVVQFPGGDGGPERLAAGKIMKITKQQLRKIIKEVSPADMSMHDAADHYEQQRASGPAGVQLSNDLFEELLEYLEDMAGFNMKGGGFVKSRGRELLAKVQKEVGAK